MFLHKVFGYRGVILFPWLARVYDRDMPTKTPSTRDRLMDTENPTLSTPIGGGVGKEVKGRTHTYYQVLIDGRDTPYITHRAQTESVTFLGNHSENTRNLYAIPGLDYVAHEDILPYTTAETNPLQHELFDKFLMYQEGKDPPFAAQDTLRAWQEKNHPWLELSDVHKETTENIRVTVIPFYMGFRQGFEETMMYVWLVCVLFQGEPAEQRVLVEVLHQVGEPGGGHGAAQREELEDFLLVRNSGDCSWSWSGWSGASAIQGPASLPVQLSCVFAGS